MRRYSALLVAVVLLGAGAVRLYAQSIPLPNCRVWAREFEEERWTDLWSKNWDAVGKLIAPGFQSLRPDGVRDRAAELALLHKLDFKNHHPYAYRVTYSGNVAIVTYKTLFYTKANGSDAKSTREETMGLSVWKRTSGGWQCIAQADLNPAPPPARSVNG